MRRSITPDPDPIPQLDDLPTEQLGPPQYDDPVCGARPDGGLNLACGLPPHGPDTIHLYDPIPQAPSADDAAVSQVDDAGDSVDADDDTPEEDPDTLGLLND